LRNFWLTANYPNSTAWLTILLTLKIFSLAVLFFNNDYITRKVEDQFLKKAIVCLSRQILENSYATILASRILEKIHQLKCPEISSIRDFRFRWSEEDLNGYFKRATPLKWMKYFCSKSAINLYLLARNGPPMSFKLQTSAYINDCQPGKAHFMDTSRLKIGKQSLLNRLTSLRAVNFDWTHGIDKHKLRIELKKTFVD